MSKTVSKFALAAGVALAMAFTFSCGEVEGGENGESSSSVGGGGNPSSSSNGGNGNPSSSSVGGSSSGGYLSCSEAWGIVTSCASQYGREGAAFDGCVESGGICGSNAFDAICKNHYGSECPEFSGSSCPSVGLGGVNPSELSNQPVAGLNSDTTINLYMVSYGDSKDDSIPVGKIEDGLLSLDLPTQSVIGEYLSELGGGASAFNTSSLATDVPECSIRLYLVTPGEEARIRFWYVSKAVQPCPDPDENFDMNFSQGWNFVYQRNDGYRTTDRSIIGSGTLEWQFNCNSK